MPKVKEVIEDNPVVQIETNPDHTIQVPREMWEALVARVSNLEEQFERFVRQYKMINSTVQEIHWRFTQMLQAQNSGEFQ